MTGEINIKITETEKRTSVGVHVKVLNCGVLDKLHIVESICESLNTSLEEMSLASILVSSLHNIPDKSSKSESEQEESNNEG